MIDKKLKLKPDKPKVEHSAKKREDVVPPFFRAGIWYEITLNLDNHNQGFDAATIKDPLMRAARIYGKYNDIMNKLLGSAEWKLQPELSEFQKLNYLEDGPRLHYHGIVKFLNNECVAEFLFSYYRNMTRHCDIQFNQYRSDYWPYYCSKQKDIMKIFCKKNGIPYFIRHK